MRETKLPQGDVEIRIWRDGFSLEGVFLKRIDGLWIGRHITTNKYDEPEKVKVRVLNVPRSGWESFSQQLIAKEILTLPQSTENECDISSIDGSGYLVEISQNKIYRNYYYPQGDGKKCREAKQMNDIGEFIGREFYSGKIACKLGEWLFCAIAD